MLGRVEHFMPDAHHAHCWCVCLYYVRPLYCRPGWATSPLAHSATALERTSRRQPRRLPDILHNAALALLAK